MLRRVEKRPVCRFPNKKAVGGGGGSWWSWGWVWVEGDRDRVVR